MKTRVKRQRGPKGSWREEATLVHEGKEFTSGGAMVTPTHVIGYPKKANGGLILTAWNGKRIGHGRIVSSWPCRSPRGGPCWQGSTIYQMEFRVGNKCFTGRGFGDGMIFRGRLKKGKCNIGAR